MKPFKHNGSGRIPEDKHQTEGKLKHYVNQILSSIGTNTATFERLLGY